jgi:hypothetical protein
MLLLAIVTGLPTVPTPGTAPAPRWIRPTPGRIGPTPRRPDGAVEGAARHPAGTAPSRSRARPAPGGNRRGSDNDAATWSPPSAARSPPDPPTDPASANKGGFLHEAGFSRGPAELIWRRAHHCGRPIDRCAKRKGSREDCGCKYGLTHATSPCVLARTPMRRALVHASRRCTLPVTRPQRRTFRNVSSKRAPSTRI